MIRLMKKVAYYLSIGVAGFIVLLFIGIAVVNVYITDNRATRILTSQIESRLNATASLQVTHFSLFHGFEIKNFKLFVSGDTAPLLQFDTFKLKYSLLPMFIGKVNIYEVGLYNPSIVIDEHKGVWNFQRMLKPSEKKEKEKKEEKQKAEAGEAITLPIPVEFLFNFIVQNLSITVHGSTYELRCNDFSSYITLHAPSISSIPLNIKAFTLFDTMDITINPQKTLQLSFISKDVKAGPPLLFSFHIAYHPDQKQLSSSFICGTYTTPLRFVQKHVAPLNAKIEYDIIYNPSTDILRCNTFVITFNQSTWVSFAGSILHVNKNPTISFAMLDSNIRLHELYTYTSKLIGPSPYLNGTVSLFPLVITGTGSNFTIKGTISGQNVAVATGGFSITVPSFTIPYTVAMSNTNVAGLLQVHIPHFYYVLGEKSKDNGADLLCELNYNRNTGFMQIHRFVMVHRDADSAKEALRCEMDGTISLHDTIQARIAVHPLMINMPVLTHTLPAHLKQALSSSPITKPVNVTLNTTLQSSKKVNTVELAAILAIPDYDIDDLRLSASIAQKPAQQKITISVLELSSNKKNMTIRAHGNVVMGNDPMIDVSTGLTVAPAKPVVFADYSLSGQLAVIMHLKGTVQKLSAKGNVVSKKLQIENKPNKLYVGPVDINIPVMYTMGESFELPFDVADSMNIELFKPDVNVSIGRIVAKHPSRDIAFEYMSSCKGYIGCKRNTLEIKNVQATVMGGTVTLKELLFNLADLKPENMGFRVAFNVNDIDIGKLDNPSSIRIHHSSLLSMNAQMEGKNLTTGQNLDVSGTATIYKIGEQFANRLFKGLNEERGKSKLGMAQFAVDNSLIISGFDFYIDKGLVYPTVVFKRKILGAVVTVNNERVRYERIPVMEFFNKVREESL